MEPVAESRDEGLTAVPRFCVNCQHVGTNGAGEAKLFRCFAPANVYPDPDLVTGGKRYKSLYCYDVRTSIQLCGPNGSWFEQRTSPVIHEYTFANPRGVQGKIGPASADKLLSDLENL